MDEVLLKPTAVVGCLGDVMGQLFQADREQFRTDLVTAQQAVVDVDDIVSPQSQGHTVTRVVFGVTSDERIVLVFRCSKAR